MANLNHCNGKNYGELIIEKSRGNLTLQEIEDYLRYSPQGSLQGNWVIPLKCGESTCEGS